MPILGIFRSFAAVGVDPAVMGIGPAHAIPAALKQANLSVEDIDLFELNEAFASQVRIVFCSFQKAFITVPVLRAQAHEGFAVMLHCQG